MAKLLSTQAPLRFVPQDQAARPEGERIAYHISPPSVYSAPKLHRAVNAQGARFVTKMDLLDALEDGLRAMLPEEAQADTLRPHLAIVAGYRDWYLAAKPEERVRVNLTGEHEVFELFEIVARHYPRLSEMQADEQWFWDVFGIEGSRLFVVDWENLPGQDGAPAVCERGPDGLTEASLGTIPNHHRQLIGVYVYKLLSPTEQEAKNSGSPPPGSPAPSSSTATAKTPPQKSPSRTTPGPSRKSASTS